MPGNDVEDMTIAEANANAAIAKKANTKTTSIKDPSQMTIAEANAQAAQQQPKPDPYKLNPNPTVDLVKAFDENQKKLSTLLNVPANPADVPENINARLQQDKVTVARFKNELAQEQQPQNNGGIPGAVMRNLTEGTAGIFQGVQGDVDFVANALGIPKENEADFPMITGFGDLAKLMNTGAANVRDFDTNTLAGGIAKGVTQAIPLIVEMRLTPELAIGMLGGAGIIELPQIATAIGFNNFGQTYANTGNIVQSLESGVKGVGTGLIYHGLGEFAKSVQGGVEGLTGNKIISSAVNPIVQGVGFGSMDALQQFAHTGQVDMHSVLTNAGTGIAFGLPEFATAIGNARAKSLFTSSPDAIKAVNNSTKSSADLRQSAVDLGSKVDQTTEPEQRLPLLLQQNALIKAANIKDATDAIVNNYTHVVNAIAADKSLTDVERDFYTKKVNTIYSDNEPHLKEAKPLNDQIAALNNDNTNITNGTLTDVAKATLINTNNAKISDLQKQVNEIMNKPIVPITTVVTPQGEITLDLTKLTKLDNFINPKTETNVENTKNVQANKPTGSGVTTSAAPESAKTNEQQAPQPPPENGEVDHTITTENNKGQPVATNYKIKFADGEIQSITPLKEDGTRRPTLTKGQEFKKVVKDYNATNMIEPDNEKSLHNDLVTSLKNYNSLTKNEKNTKGANLKGKIDDLVNQLGYSLSMNDKGDLTALTDKNTPAKLRGTHREADEVQADKDAKATRKELLNKEPTNLTMWALQYVLSGGKVQTDSFERATGLGHGDRMFGIVKNEGPALDELHMQLQDNPNASHLAGDYNKFETEVSDVLSRYKNRQEMWRDLSDLAGDKEQGEYEQTVQQDLGKLDPEKEKEEQQKVDEIPEESLDQLVQQAGLVDKNGKLDKAKLKQELNSLSEGSYFGGLVFFNNEQIEELKNLVHGYNESGSGAKAATNESTSAGSNKEGTQPEGSQAGTEEVTPEPAISASVFNERVDADAEKTKQALRDWKITGPEGVQQVGFFDPEKIVDWAANVVKMAHTLKISVEDALNRWMANNQSIFDPLKDKEGFNENDVRNEILDHAEQLVEQQDSNYNALKDMAKDFPDRDAFDKFMTGRYGDKYNDEIKGMADKAFTDIANEKAEAEKNKQPITAAAIKLMRDKIANDKTWQKKAGDFLKGTYAARIGGGIWKEFDPFSYFKEISEGQLFNNAELAGIKLRQRLGEYNAWMAKTEKASNRMRLMFEQWDPNTALAFYVEAENGIKSSDPTLQNVADGAHQRMKNMYNIVNGIKEINEVEDYLPHFWKKPDKAQSFFAKEYAKKPLEGSKYFQKSRTFSDLAKGIDAGLEPVFTNPENNLRFAEIECMKLKLAHDYFNDLKDLGMIKYFKTGMQEDGYKLVDDPLFKRMALFTVKETTPQLDIYGNQDIETKAAMSTGGYYMPEGAAEIVNRYLGRGIGGIGKVALDGLRGINNTMNMAQLSWSAFHGTFTTFLYGAHTMRLGIVKLSRAEGSGFVDLVKGNPIGTIFTLPPDIIHAGKVLNQIKGVKDYQNPIITEEANRLIQSNAAIGLDKVYQTKALDAYKTASAQMVGAMSRGELGNSLIAYGKRAWYLPAAAFQVSAMPLMKFYVPRMKIAAALRMQELERGALGENPNELQLRKADQVASDKVDNAFGQVVYDNIFWSKSVKEMGFAVLRAFGWFLGEGRMFAEAAKGVVKLPVDIAKAVTGINPPGETGDTHWKGINSETALMMGIIANTAMASAMLQYALTYAKTGKGVPPRNSKDLFAPWDGTYNPDGSEHRILVRSYLTDAMGVSNNGLTKTIYNKIAPGEQLIVQLFQNKDFYNNQIYNTDDKWYQKGLEGVSYAAQSIEPISFRTQHSAEDAAQHHIEQFFGATAASQNEQRPEWENIIYDEADKNNFEKPKTKVEADRLADRSDVRQLIYEGKPYEKELKAAEDKGHISKKEKYEFIKESKLLPAYRLFKNLSAESQAKLYFQLPEEEQAKIREELHTKEEFRELKKEQPELFTEHPEYEELIKLAHEKRRVFRITRRD